LPNQYALPRLAVAVLQIVLKSLNDTERFCDVVTGKHVLMNGCPTPQKFSDFGNDIKDVGRDVVERFVTLTLMPIAPSIKSDKKPKTTILPP
jgi:hypothetical protein